MKCKFGMFLFVLILLGMPSAGIGFSKPQNETRETSPKSEEENAKFINRCLQFPTVIMDECYRRLMVAYACAVQVGGEAEQKAKDNLEHFYKQLHNNSTFGIDKIYRNAKELGCKQEKP